MIEKYHKIKVPELYWTSNTDNLYFGYDMVNIISKYLGFCSDFVQHVYIHIYIYTGEYLTLPDLQIWSVICTMVPSYQQTKINQFKLLKLKFPGLSLSSNAQYKMDNSSWDTDRVFWGIFYFVRYYMKCLTCCNIL